MKVDLRKVEFNDIEKIRNWRNSELIRNVSHAKDYITADMQKKWFETASTFENQFHWIIVINGVDAGYAAIKYIDLKSASCEFSSLYIGEPAFLLNGAGAWAEYKVIDYVFLNFPFVNKIYCEVLALNKKVIQLHKRFGFSTDDHILSPDSYGDRFKDLVLLALFKDKWLDVKEGISKLLR
jgi:RimJ/RimL family protein N-acetyltransferase